ncbi:MAG: response regulator, partial [Spirochaetales bacterium]|nr:response regulator [Spirochaetales bacterium]
MAEDKKPTILIVDDTETNIDILVEVLGDEYELSVATNGLDAIELATEEIPDLVLLDIMMPDMDGYEVCSRLKKNERTRDIPVIFVTAMSEIGDEAKGFDMGAVDYITKPISPPIVFARVRSALTLKKKTEDLSLLSRKLSKYLAPQVYVSIFRGDQDVAIESKRKKLSVFFSDIVNFTQTTEGMEAEDLSDLLNLYLEEMAAIAINHGGTIDKFIGDAILIFYGDPLTRGVQIDALECVSMAIEMRSSLEKMRNRWFELGIEKPFRIRAGISTGYCTVGNFGSKNRMDYTIIGSQVNIAARLESQADPDQILISHETWSAVKDKIHCIRLKPVSVKGISQPIIPYQVIDFVENLKGELSIETIGSLSSECVSVATDETIGRTIELLVADSGDGHAVLLSAQDNKPCGIVSVDQ